MRKYFYCFILLFPLVCSSQTFEGRTFNTKNGLCDNETSNIFQDKKGFIWILSSKGLSVFDGKNMKKFPDKIGEVGEGKDGLIYATTFNSISKYNSLKKVGTVIPPGISDKIYIKDKEAYLGITKFVDKDGIVYYYFLRGGASEKKDTIAVFKDGSIKKISIKDKRDKGYKLLPFLDNNNKLWAIFFNSNNNQNLLCYFENGELIDTKITFNSESEPLSIFQSKNKEIYVFYNTTVFHIKDRNIQQVQIDPKLVTWNLYDKKAEDSKGNIWMVHAGGLIKISGNSAEVIEDHKPRAVQCDSIIESSYDSKGNEIITKKWMCDGSTYAGGLAVDSKDRIFTGNKVYENGKFTEVFPVKSYMIIYKILIDREDNAWYATANGVFKYQPLPISNLSKIDNISGEFIGVDNNKTIYTKKMHSYVDKDRVVYVYSFNKKDNSYHLYDSIRMQLEKNYMSKFGWAEHYVRILPALKRTLIINEGTVISFDGKKLEKYDLQKLSFTPAKFKFGGDNELFIKEGSLFNDDEGYAWFFYNGNYIKTDGETFKCFGTECGLADLENLSGFCPGNQEDHDLRLKNILFSSKGFYILKNDKFTLYPYEKYNLPEGGARTQFWNDEKGGFYLFFDSIFSRNKQHTFLRFANGTFTPYTINNPQKILISSGLSMKAYGKRLLLDLADNGFATFEIDDNSKTVNVSDIKIGKEYLTYINTYRTGKNKLFLLPDAASIVAFSIDTISYKIGETFNLSEYGFNTNVIENGGEIFLNSSSGFDERGNWTVKIDKNTDFFNRTENNLNIVSLSYASKDSTLEIYHSFSGIEVPFDFNPLKINFKGVCTSDGEKVKYKYFLEGLDTKWNEITDDNVTYSSLHEGKYTFKLLSCNNHGVWNTKPVELTFTVLPPWNRTWWAYCTYVVAGFAAIRGYLKNRTRKLEKEKEKLEKTVQERTEEVTLQKHLLEEKNKEMIDSITYARRIQRSLMPTDKYISRVLGKKK